MFFVIDYKGLSCYTHAYCVILILYIGKIIFGAGNLIPVHANLIIFFRYGIQDNVLVAIPLRLMKLLTQFISQT